DRAAQQVILENIKMTKEPEKFQLLKMSAERVLSNLSETFDLVLLDPPYAKEQIVENLELLQEKKRLTENVIVVCETDKEVELPDLIGKLELTRQKTYGISKISIYEF
ncbi:MAG: RsmD family RNA methyltransferase, partial [Lactococcus lactis]